MKIGNLDFKRDYAARKPIWIKPTGERVMPSDFRQIPLSLAGTGALSVLGEDDKIKLVVERNELEPDYKLGIVGGNIFTKDEVISQVQAKTKLGKEIVTAELNYVNHLISDLSTGDALALTPKPKIPAVKPEKKPTNGGEVKFFPSHVLFCEDTVTDDLTKNAAKYRIEKVHPAFKKRGFTLHELKGSKTDRANAKPIAKNKRVAYISGIGHGGPDEYTGHNTTTVLKSGLTEAGEVKGKIVHLLSCLTAQDLGPYLVKKGAKAYAGYYESFYTIPDEPSTPLDEMGLFWECDSTFDMMILTGATVKEAHKATMAMYDAAIDLVPGTVSATWLQHDQYYFRSPVTGKKYGDKKAKISAWTRNSNP